MGYQLKTSCILCWITDSAFVTAGSPTVATVKVVQVGLGQVHSIPAIGVFCVC